MKYRSALLILMSCLIIQGHAHISRGETSAEKQILLNALLAGDKDVSGTVENLLQKDGSNMLAAIQLAIAEVTDFKKRYQLISEIARLESKMGRALLRSEMKTAPSLMSRVAAAKYLYACKHPDVIPAMLREWYELDEPMKCSEEGELEKYPRHNCDPLLDFLGSVMDKVVDKIVINIDQRPAIVLEGLMYRLAEQLDYEEDRVSAEQKKVFERVLLTILEDKRESVCHRAAMILRCFWPQFYSYDPDVRGYRQRIAFTLIRNKGRDRWGKPRIEIPKPTSEDIYRNGTLKVNSPLIEDLLSRKTKEKVAKDLAIFREMGVPSLPALAYVLKEEQVSPPFRTQVTKTVHDLSNRIVQVALDGDLDPLGPDDKSNLKKVLNVMEGQTLSIKSLTRIMPTLISLKQHTHLRIIRYGDIRGIDLKVVIRGPSYKYHLPLNLKVKGEVDWQCAGKIGEITVDEKAFIHLSQDFNAWMDKTLKLPPDQSFQLTIDMMKRSALQESTTQKGGQVIPVIEGKRY